MKVGLLFAVFGSIGCILIDTLLFDGPNFRGVWIGSSAAFLLGFAENFFRGYGAPE
jgi:hypothetical protein